MPAKLLEWKTVSPQKHDYLDKEIKSFIAHELQKQKEEIVEMIGGTKTKAIGREAILYNSALDDIIKKTAFEVKMEGGHILKFTIGRKKPWWKFWRKK